MLDKHLDILGYEVTDRVTGFKGVATSISFDLYGCVMALVTPQLDDKGQMQGREWFDTNRLKAIGTEPVMMVPSFEKFSPGKVPGGQQLPLP